MRDIEIGFQSISGPHVQAIVGLGGIGKTQLAIEYAWRHHDQYKIVWWLPSDDPTTLALAYVELARQIGLRMVEPMNLDVVRHDLRRALPRISQWLLIFDNAVSAEAIGNYLPMERSGHVLITSRDTDWAGVAQSYPLRRMERAESISFLHRRVGRWENETIVNKVAMALGDHPLAMEQAGAHVVETRIDYATYLKRFESHWFELMEQGSGRVSPGAEYPDALAMSLELSFLQLEDLDPSAQALLNFLSFLAGESIPLSLLQIAASMSEILPEDLIPIVIDDQVREAAMATLRRYSLIEIDQQSAHVHRLVAALCRRRRPTVDQAELASACLQIVNAAFAFDSQQPQSWPVCAAVLPHALAVAEHAEELGVAAEGAARLLDTAGCFMMKQGRFDESLTALNRSLSLAKTVHGPNHPLLAVIHNDLGRVLQKRGDPAAAREHFDAALAIDEKIYGLDDAHPASVINNYAITLHGDGDFAGAREHYERALASHERKYGADDRRVAHVRNNLACAIRDSGDVATALAQFRLALDAARVACGETHPLVAQITFNLGALLHATGQSEAALTLIEQALIIDRLHYGEMDPQIKRDLAILAAITASQRFSLPSASRS